MIAYLIYHGVAGPLGLIVNFIIFIILAVLLFWVVQWAAGEFGIPAKVVKLVGILLFLAIILALFTGCAIIPTQHGKAQLWGDYSNVSLDDGSVHFHADTAVHSTVVRAHWHGVSNVTSEVVAGAIGLRGGNQALGAASSVAPAFFNRPTTRSTPTPRP